MSITISGAEAINTRQSIPDWYGPSTLSFFALDDVGCNGSESNLLNCLPQHNCGMNRGTENAGVQCLRKGMEDQINKKNTVAITFSSGCFRNQTRVWTQPRKQQHFDHSESYAYTRG
jgi:hypothetical protein